jgi:hypothetical protein
LFVDIIIIFLREIAQYLLYKLVIMVVVAYIKIVQMLQKI